MDTSRPAPPPPAAHWSADGARAALRLGGSWSVRTLLQPPTLALPAGARAVTVQADGLTLDSAGALLMAQAVQSWRDTGAEVDLSGLEATHRKLLELVSAKAGRPPATAPGPRLPLLDDIGRGATVATTEFLALLAFVGELVWNGLPQLLQPWRIRWREVVAEIDAAGLRALGIIGLLSFLIGMVMAYQSGATLATYGANILIVNLVSIITLRELGPLLTAILVAGRTGSSYTAQIGTMRITEEVDALRALGLSPFDMLVFPKVIALVVTVPLLSLFADLMGLAGGGLVASVGYNVPVSEYISRIPQVVGVKTLVLGLIKAPVFAVVIALVGCLQGLRVAGSASAVGRATTVSVVQSIFLVIVIDATFSVVYNLLGL